MPYISKRIGLKKTHAFSLITGGLGLLSIFIFKDPKLLIISMIGVGFAWGSILAMPYAILSGSLPAKKMGVYMGIFNFFITFPQIVNGFFGGFIVKHLYNGQAIYAIVIAGVCMLLGALSVLRVNDESR
ncbi:Major Facilitator Superfamily protein [compost metagenome]